LGKRAIGLTVVKENERALRLYAKCGFRVVREVTFRAEHDSFEMILDFPSAEARG
jgi:RimJ/RimL family protein N-acetyltransferase